MKITKYYLKLKKNKLLLKNAISMKYYSKWKKNLNQIKQKININFE